MGRELMQAVKWLVAKLQGDKTAHLCEKISGREVTGSAFPDRSELPKIRDFLRGSAKSSLTCSTSNSTREKKHIKKKRMNRIFTGLSRILGGTSFTCFILPISEAAKPVLFSPFLLQI